MKVYLVSYITNKIKHCTKLSELWIGKSTILHNKLMQLKNSMLMGGIHNAETLQKLINTVHNVHNTTCSHERLFAGQQKLSNTMITLCKFIRFKSLFHKFTAIFVNSAR